jgi:hypothetical protein
MQIAAHVLAYNVTRFIQPVLLNMEPFVDKIYVAHSPRPFGYLPCVRESKSNPTTLNDIRAVGIGPKLEIVEGDWLDEESMRNECFTRAKADGMDWFVTQDADEFYTERGWRDIRQTLMTHGRDDHFVTTWLNFWKSAQYVLLNSKGEMKETNASFAIRCRSNLRFVSRRLTNACRTSVIDCPCYHYGYVMNDVEMLDKVSTWSHAHEVRAVNQWFRNKWLNWREATRFLHPINPLSWSRAIRFPLEQPEFAAHFTLPVFTEDNLTSGDVLSNSIYDAKAQVEHCVRALQTHLLKALHALSPIR